MACLLGVDFSVHGLDLTNDIYSTLQKRENGFQSNSYLESSYQVSYPKDPFSDALNDLKDMSVEVEVAWIDYIEKALAEKNCSLSKKKIQSILYYFIPEFRAEVLRDLKFGLWEYDNSKFAFDKDKIESYCLQFYYCDKYSENSWDSKLHIWEIVTSKTPANIMSDCKEFFQENYKKGKINKKMMQDVAIAQVWADKYWNSTMDDSPYDIMVDFWWIWRLLYTDVEQPVQPVHYKLPMFSNSVKSSQDRKEKESSYSQWWTSRISGTWYNSTGTLVWGIGQLSGSQLTWYTAWWNIGWQVNNWDNPQPLPLSTKLQWFDIDDYDDLLEWLWSSRLIQNNSLYYGSLCEDEEELKQSWTLLLDKQSNKNLDSSEEYDLSKLSDEEFETVVDYVKTVVNKYSELSEEQKKEIKNRAWDTGSFVNDTTPEDLEKTAKQIKNCWKSCDWLRYDQKASCMLMCACWEIESPIFDPDKNSWLWPILIVRFCAIPATNTSFSIWWRKIISIQEWMNEIYGVTDKLSREWRLWIWTQQYNFLDSTTKKTNISNTVAFTISVETVDTSEKTPKYSEQYQKKEAAVKNKDWQEKYHISNALNNPDSKNRYRLVSEEGDSVDDLSASANADLTRQNQGNVVGTPSSDVNLVENSHANRYTEMTQTLSRFLDQQWGLWTQMNDSIKQLDDYATVLYSKRW